MHGKDVTIPKGTEVTAYISGDVKLDPAKFQPAPLVPFRTASLYRQQVPSSSPAATPNGGPTGTAPGSLDQRAAAELEVSSTPDCADIEIDGNFVGSTPSTLGVAAGPHQLSAKKAGFKALGTKNYGVERTHQD